MASILERYGIKEVADVTFYSIDAATGRPRTPILYVDTAKTTTTEVTAETSYAEGGKGNGRLLAWDFGKEITVTLEDAVFSAKSLSIMFGDGTAPVDTISLTTNKVDIDGSGGSSTGTATNHVYRTLVFPKDTLIGKTLTQVKGLVAEALGRKASESASFVGDLTFTAAESDIAGNPYAANQDNYQLTASTGSGDTITGFTYTHGHSGVTYADDRVFVSFLVKVSGYQLTVGPDNFPGTYYITMNTYARSEASGEDEEFMIVIPKGKITSENTITMEADGDPSVFNMNIEVLRTTIDAKPVMMYLIKYRYAVSASAGTDAGLVLDTRLVTVQSN